MCGEARGEDLLVVARGAFEVDGAGGALLAGGWGVFGGGVGRGGLGRLVFDCREGVAVDVVQRGVVPRVTGAELLLRPGGGGFEGGGRVLGEVAARAEDLGGDRCEGVRGGGGGRGGVEVGPGGVEVLLARAEELFGAVGLQRDVVREVAEEVGED